MIKQAPDQYQEIRDAVRALCAEFPDEYHRQIDHDRAYPEAFVDALTKAGWLAALIPAEYGGSGLGLAIVRRVMALHGGRMHVANTQPGLRVTLEFNR